MYYEYEYCYEDTIEKDGKFVPTYSSERGIVAASSYEEAMELVIEDYGEERCPSITLIQISSPTFYTLTLKDDSGYSYDFKIKKERNGF